MRLRRENRELRLEREILKTVTAFFRQRERVRFRVIEAEKAVSGVRRQCRVVQVAPSGYYAWRPRPVSALAREDAQLLRVLQVEHAASRQPYGRLRLQRALPARGLAVGDKRIRRLMRAGPHDRQRARMAGRHQPPRASRRGGDAHSRVGRLHSANDYRSPVDTELALGIPV